MHRHPAKWTRSLVGTALSLRSSPRGVGASLVLWHHTDDPRGSAVAAGSLQRAGILERVPAVSVAAGLYGGWSSRIDIAWASSSASDDAAGATAPVPTSVELPTLESVTTHLREVLGEGMQDTADLRYPILWFNPDGAIYKAIMASNEWNAQLLTDLHHALGMPWWATIVASTIVIRLIMLPLNIYGLRNASRMIDARAEREQLTRAYQHAMTALGKNAKTAERMQYFQVYLKGLRAALHKHNCYPSRSFIVPTFQIPLLIATMFGARHLVMAGDASFETGGFAWFTDLTVSDPTYILPAISAALGYVALEILFYSPKQKGIATTASLFSAQTLLPKIKSGMQMWLIGCLPLVISMPAGLYVGWISASVWSVAYVSAIRNPTIYKMLTGKDPGKALMDMRIQDIQALPQDEAAAAAVELEQVAPAAEGVNTTTLPVKDTAAVEDLPVIPKAQQISVPR